ncbi:MAG: PIN domain nuclease [Elusimicrobia bacterium]|nr:MAG: PIN domain nuclease [Elusimicrobiota bacterium]
MLTWVYRAAILLACPAFAYFVISKETNSLIVGLGAGVLIVVFELLLEGMSLLTMIVGLIGAIGGLAGSKFLNLLIQNTGLTELVNAWDRFAPLSHFALTVLGMVVAIKKFPELDSLDKDIIASARRRGSDLKVLDTSAIIDGRVVDICETKFLSGVIVVPRFVLNELHHLADSEDDLRRARGRRGLDMLARMQENPDVPIKIIDRDIPDIKAVDGKLVQLAKDLSAKVMTTDFNLNKIAALEGVVCLNVNDLTTALKPVVLPGEMMTLFVMKEGKERSQGVGYLDDGTMVIIEEAKERVGKRVDAQVTSILQTSAGRMVFSKYRGDH